MNAARVKPASQLFGTLSLGRARFRGLGGTMMTTADALHWPCGSHAPPNQAKQPTQRHLLTPITCNVSSLELLLVIMYKDKVLMRTRLLSLSCKSKVMSNHGSPDGPSLSLRSTNTCPSPLASTVQYSTAVGILQISRRSTRHRRPHGVVAVLVSHTFVEPWSMTGDFTDLPRRLFPYEFVRVVGNKVIQFNSFWFDLEKRIPLSGYALDNTIVLLVENSTVLPEHGFYFA